VPRDPQVPARSPDIGQEQPARVSLLHGSSIPPDRPIRQGSAT
jgi:hypothetical protein